MRKPNASCDNKDGLKKGPWTSDEDKKLLDFIERHGHGSWRSLPEKAGDLLESLLAWNKF